MKNAYVTKVKVNSTCKSCKNCVEKVDHGVRLYICINDTMTHKEWDVHFITQKENCVGYNK